MKSILLALLSFACALTGAAQSPPAQFASRTALIAGISANCGQMGLDIATDQPVKKRASVK